MPLQQHYHSRGGARTQGSSAARPSNPFWVAPDGDGDGGDIDEETAARKTKRKTAQKEDDSSEEEKGSAKKTRTAAISVKKQQII